jgi:hypothetical protein
MTPPHPDLAPPPVQPGDPRRVGLAELVGQLVAGTAALGRGYERAAPRAPEALQRALRDLARSKEGQTATLAPLARALGGPEPTSAPPGPLAMAGEWGVVLGEAFQAERALELAGRQLGALAEDPAVRALAAQLAAGAARDRAEVRKLYLRYS